MRHDHLLLHFSRNGAYGPGGAELLVIDRGEGAYLYDVHGRRYVDAFAGLACTQLGHSYGAEIAEAVTRQLERLPFNTLWSTAHPRAIELSDELVARAPEGIGKVFFTSGGTDAVEAIWKLARQYHLANDEPQRTKAIARKIAYHGASLGALAITGVEPFKAPFGPPAIPVSHVSTTNRYRSDETDEQLCARLLAEVEETIEREGPDTIALIIAEPVQNSGGCFTPPAGYWPGLREIADRHGILLAADEVISGMGRIGEWFAISRYDTAPDFIAIAKGLTSAYAPMGAALVADRVAEPLYREKTPLLHGLTFGGHPLSAAVALKTIEIFERDGVLENVRARTATLRDALERLRRHPIVGDVRGEGFFWAIELVKDEHATRFDADERERLLRGYLPGRMLEAGLIARADDRGDSVIQLAPPLISDDAVIEEIADGLDAVLADATVLAYEGATAPVAR